MKIFCSNNREIGKECKKESFSFIVTSQAILMFLITLCVLFAAMNVSATLAAKNELKHPIDIWLKHCIGSNSTTAGINTCTFEAINSWDKEMSKAYKELMATLPVKQRAVLKKSQVAWLKFRDEESNFLDNFYGNFQGSIWSNILLGGKLNILQQRTLMLQVYLQYLKGN